VQVCVCVRVCVYVCMYVCMYACMVKFGSLRQLCSPPRATLTPSTAWCVHICGSKVGGNIFSCVWTLLALYLKPVSVRKR
jgi:hypothetical protein